MRDVSTRRRLAAEGIGMRTSSTLAGDPTHLLLGSVLCAWRLVGDLVCRDDVNGSIIREYSYYCNTQYTDRRRSGLRQTRDDRRRMRKLQDTTTSKFQLLIWDQRIVRRAEPQYVGALSEMEMGPKYLWRKLLFIYSNTIILRICITIHSFY